MQTLPTLGQPQPEVLSSPLQVSWRGMGVRSYGA
jgi:hypothetical protein